MTLKLNGSSSGSVSIDAPASTTGGADLTYTLPNATTGGVIRTTTTPGAIVQVKNVDFNSGIANIDHPAQNSSQTWWEYDNANLRVGLTPTSTSNKILIMGHVNVGLSTAGTAYIRLYRRLASGTGATVGSNTATNSTAPLCIATTGLVDQSNCANCVSITFYDTPANTSDEHVYYYGFTHDSSSTRLIGINRTADDSGNYYNGRSSSAITLMEVAG